MESSGVHATEIVFLALLLFVVAFAALARKLKIPYPIVLVIAGLLLGFVPGIPKISLNPDLIFLVVLPPLLYAGGWVTSWRDFKHNMVSICLLAFGLVGFTVFGVAGAAHYLFHGFDWRLGLVLGAVVATTDAIAATSIAKQVGLPKRIVDILEGESLVNDATGLLALEFAIAIVVDGRTPSLAEGALRLGWLTFGGLGVGLLIALVVEWIEKHLDDGPIEVAFSLFVPYAAYLGAEAAHASGVLAVVACGLYLGYKSVGFFSAGVRIQIGAVWESLTFVLNGLVFILIGLQLPYVLGALQQYSKRELVWYGLLFSALVILLRMLWMYPGAHVAYFVRRRILGQDEKVPGTKQIFVVGWAGMRGVVALAAAIGLPETLSDGSPFPQRDLIIFLTFSVILVTLVLQGLSLPPLIRLLGLANVAEHDEEEETARRTIIAAALAYLEQKRASDDGGPAALYDELAKTYKARLVRLKQRAAEPKKLGPARRLRLMNELIQVERQTAVNLRNDGRINDEVLRQIQYELDLSETRLSLV